MKKARRRSNQELRTRKDLLAAARRLLKQGQHPTMDEVAKEALVSRPTAYRYFSSVDSLLNEAAVEEATVDAFDILEENRSQDPEKRLLTAEAALHRSCYANETQLRIMLAHAIQRPASEHNLPARQNRRMPLIEAALAPAKDRIPAAAYRRLCLTLALIFGPESMIVFQDVLRVDEAAAQDVKTWAIRTLLRGALSGR